ncbi:hypothetical protein PTKIN_Ptkin04bG0050500 [Pterospermum kingtungense]
MLNPNLKLSLSPPAEISSAKIPTGTFRDGNLLVNKDGVRIVSQSKPEAPPPMKPSETDDNQLSLEDIEVIKVIGKGNGGSVQLVQHKWTGQFFALKITQMNMEESARKQIAKELKITQSAQCPYVVVCYQAFYTNGAISTILEYMDGGSLADFLKKVKSIPEPYLAAICKQVVMGLIYLHHERYILHRDLKPSNLLINYRGEVKITDLGVSKILTSSSERANTFVGTYNYMSPERISGDNYGIECDIWSLGLVLLECATGRFPYSPPEPEEGWTNFFELMEQIVEQPPPSAPSEQFSPEFCSFISACLQKDPKDRKSANELLELPFLNMYDDLDVELSSYFITNAGSMITDYQLSKYPAKMQQPLPEASGSGLTEELRKKEECAAKGIHLTDDKNEVSELPKSLIALYLQESYELTAIPPLFFQRIQVLDLSGTSIKSFPKSLLKLVLLKKLFLRGCQLFMELTPEVGELINLEELNLDETQIMDLPREIGNLLKLRHLTVSFYYVCGKKKLKSNILIDPRTISILSQLTELSIDVNPEDKRWDDSVEAVVKEVSNSKTLRTLSLYLPKFQLLDDMSLIYPSLSRFRFIVGHHKRRIVSRVPHEVEAKFKDSDKCLKFVNGESIPNEIKMVLKYSTSFFLDRHATAVNLSEFGMQNMKKLKFCLLAECNKMETLIDGMHYERHEDHDQCDSNPDSVQHVLESLEYLSIYYMDNLGSIWRGPNRYGCMSKLKFLALHTCPQLTYIFSRALLENIVNLEEIIIEDCPQVTSLVSDASVEPMMSNKIFLPSLKRLLLLYLPELVSISNGLLIALKLESMGCYNCPKLKSISKKELSSKNLKIIKGECRWWEDLNWNETEWGNHPDYLMRIFSPIDNEKDVMTQLAEDRDILEATIKNEGQQPGFAGIPEASMREKFQDSDGVAEKSFLDYVASEFPSEQSTDELLQFFSIDPSQQDSSNQKNDEQNSTPSEDGNIVPKISDCSWNKRKIAFDVKDGNPTDNKKKLIRRERERNRRQEMSNLYARLQSLLPYEYLKGKRSAFDHLHEAVKYIKHLQNRIRDLKYKRDELKRSSNLQTPSSMVDGLPDCSNDSVEKIMSRSGDWNCISCQHLNFRRMESCQTCGESRSDDLGGYGGRVGSSFGFTTGFDVQRPDGTAEKSCLVCFLVLFCYVLNKIRKLVQI